MNKNLRTFLFVLTFGILFLVLPLPIKFPDINGVFHVLWVNGLFALKVSGIDTFAIGLITFSSAGFLSSKLKFGECLNE